LETFPLHQKLQSPASEYWHGDWPDEVDALCRRCGDKRAYWIWPSRLASFTKDWGVYMLSGTCASCCTTKLLFWVEVNPREGWMQKAGQLPAPPLPRTKASLAGN
jgi:hypothetical protein